MQESGPDGGDGRVTAVDLIADGKISFVVNTPRGRLGRSDGEAIRKAASLHRVSCVTTVDAALAAVQGLAENDGGGVTVTTAAGVPRPAGTTPGRRRAAAMPSSAM